MKSAPARCAQISSCSSAAARYVSAAATTTERPCSASLAESLPIVVVLPVPLTPTTRITAGSWATSRTGASPKSSVTSSASASLRSASSPRASSRRTSSAVARTPTSPAMSASSSRSQSASSPGSNEVAATSSPVSARRDFESESRSREKKRPPSSSGSGAASGSPNNCAQLRGELPLLVADERELGSVGQHSVHRELRPADHEVNVDPRGVHALVGLSVERIRDAESVGDVAGGVLVEQRAVEEGARLADPRLLRDERELAEPVGVLDVREVAADDVGARLGVDLHDPAVLEAEFEATDELTAEAERHARTNRSLRAARVGGGEDLLGRHVGDVLDPGRCAEARAAPMRCRQQPDREVGARPAIADRIRLQGRERARPRIEPVEVLAPCGHGIGLVEAHAERDLLPQLLDLRLAQHLPRPTLRHRADAAPVDGALAVKPTIDLDRFERDRAAHALAVEVGEQLRLGVPRRPELRIAPGRLCGLLQPLGRVRERLVRPELDHRAPDVLVGVLDVDERRACPIRLPRERAHQLGVLDEPVDEHLLSGLDVRTDPNGQFRVALEPVAHASCHSSFRISGTAVPSASTASTSSSGPPTMKSTCVLATFRPSPGSPSARNGNAAPYAMWQVAFSSKSAS